MGGQFRGSIVIRHSPVSNWEKYSRTFAPDEYKDLRVKADAEGGAISASFTLFDHSETFLHGFMLYGLGRDVRIGADDGRPLWEGYVHEMELDYGSIIYRVSLSNMANRVWVRYRIRGDVTTSRSTTMNDTLSQARYGIKEFVLGGGELESAAVADQVAQRYLTMMKWPRATPAQVRLGGKFQYPPMLSIVAKGYIETLKWRTYNQTAIVGAQNASLEVADIITAVGQFVASQYEETNTTQVTKVYDVDRTAYDIIMDIARLGDASYNRWTASMGNFPTIPRRFAYKQASPTQALAQNLNIFESKPTFRDRSGRVLRPYDVAVDRLLQVFGPSLPSLDAGIGFESRNNAYSEAVEWDEDFNLTVLTNRAERVSVLLARAAGKATI